MLLGVEASCSFKDLKYVASKLQGDQRREGKIKETEPHFFCRLIQMNVKGGAGD